MFDKKAIKAGFSRAASDYDVNAKLQETIRKKAVAVAERYFSQTARETARVLDIGCGTASLSQEKKDWDIVGVDISLGMCEVARRKTANIINADATFLPFADNSFDYVFSSLVLQWIDRPELMIKEALRVLKTDGVAVVTTFVKGTLQELAEAFSAVDNLPHVTPFIEKSQLLLLIEQEGGVVTAVYEDNYTQYYDDIVLLMRSIKTIGAGNKLSSRRKGMMTPSQLAKIAESYKKENDQYTISWHTLTLSFCPLPHIEREK